MAESKPKPKMKEKEMAEPKDKPSSHMDTICETVRERLGACTRGRTAPPASCSILRTVPSQPAMPRGAE